MIRAAAAAAASTLACSRSFTPSLPPFNYSLTHSLTHSLLFRLPPTLPSKQSVIQSVSRLQSVLGAAREATQSDSPSIFFGAGSLRQRHSLSLRSFCSRFGPSFLVFRASREVAACMGERGSRAESGLSEQRTREGARGGVGCRESSLKLMKCFYF